MTAIPVFSWQLYDESFGTRRVEIDSIIADITECWGDPLDWLPIYIAPQPAARVLQRQGYRPQNWSLPYLRGLHSLSKKTKGLLDTAHSCIFKVVSDRYDSEGAFSDIAKYPHLMVEDMDAVEQELVIALNAHNSSTEDTSMDTNRTQPSENAAETAVGAPAQVSIAAPTNEEQDVDTSDAETQPSEEANQTAPLEAATGSLGKSATTKGDKGKKRGSGMQRAREEDQKSRCIAAMSKAWVQAADEWIPEDLLPYCKGSRTERETDPSNWNLALLRALRMLSNHSKDDLDLAQVFMIKQVRMKSGDKLRPLTGADIPKASELPELMSELKARITRRAELKKKKRKAESVQNREETSRSTAGESARPGGQPEASHENDRRGSPSPVRISAATRKNADHIHMPIGDTCYSPSGWSRGGAQQTTSGGHEPMDMLNARQIQGYTGDMTLPSERATIISRGGANIGCGRTTERYAMPSKGSPCDVRYDERGSKSRDAILAIPTEENRTLAESRTTNSHRTSSERAPLAMPDTYPRYESAASSSISRRVPSLRHDSLQSNGKNVQRTMTHNLASTPCDSWNRRHSRDDHEDTSHFAGIEDRSSVFQCDRSDGGTAPASATDTTIRTDRRYALQNDAESRPLFSRPHSHKRHYSDSVTSTPSKEQKLGHSQGQGTFGSSSGNGLVPVTSQHLGVHYSQQDRAAMQYRFNPSHVGYAADADMFDVDDYDLHRGVSQTRFDRSLRHIDTTQRRDSLWQDGRGSYDEYHSFRSDHFWEPCGHRAFAGVNDDHYCNIPASMLMAKVRGLKQALLEKHLQIQDLQDKVVRLEEQVIGNYREITWLKSLGSSMTIG